jgi:O-antigen ligase
MIRRAIFFTCLLMVPAFIYSKALITICYIFFVVLAGLTWWNTPKKDVFGSFLKCLPFSLFLIVFFQIIVSGINSANTTEWTHHLIMKLPFLVLPVAFYLFGTVEERHVLFIHIWLMAILTASSIPVLFHYYQHQEELLGLLGMGQSIPTPVEHVKYSMMNAYAVLSGAIILLYYPKSYSIVIKWAIALISLWLLLYMHILAVRTGLVIVYISGLIIALLKVYEDFSFKKLVLSASLILGFIFASIQFIPSLQTKMGYMKYDWEMLRQNGGQEYSDSDRVQSLKIGWKLFEANPIIGVGIGDLRQITIEEYALTRRTEYVKLPHSQFLHQMAGSGIVGLILLLIGFYGPFYFSNRDKAYFLGFLYLNYSLSFLVENSLERSFSTAFFLFFALLSINSQRVNE